MKNNLSINSLAKSNLKHRRKQYTVMIIGILLAMIFASTISFFTSSVFSSISEYEKSNYGNSDMYIVSEHLNEDFYKKAMDDNCLSEVGLAHLIGTIYTDESRQEYNMPTAWLDEEAKELSYLRILQGRYPEKPGEIILEKAAMNILNLDISVGDSFTVYFKGQDGMNLLQNSLKKTFTLVGIAKDKRQNHVQDFTETATFPGAFVHKDEKIAPGSRELIGGYANYTDIELDFFGIDDYIEKYGVKYTDYNITFIRLNADGKFGNSNSPFLLALAIIFSVVLLFASFIGIINAMNSNFSDRKKQIGMLRTVGATKRQIRKIFGREAILISLFCTPVSVLVSYLGTKLIIGLFFNDDVVFVPNIAVLLISAAFSVLSVMVASAIPLFFASRISPVQSIRNIEITRQMKSKRIKSKNNFSVSKLIANRNLKFYKRKQIAVSLFLIITVVISTFGFSYLKYEKNNYYRWTTSDYRIHLSTRSSGGYYNIKEYNTGFGENQKQDMESSVYFKEVTGEKNIAALVEVKEYDNYLHILEYAESSTLYVNRYDKYGNYIADEENLYEFSEDYYDIKSLCNFENEFFGLDMIGLGDSVIESFKDNVIDGKINIDKINSGEEIIIIAPKKIAYGYYDDGRYYTHCDQYINEKENEYSNSAECTFKAGEMIDITIITAEENTQDYDSFKNPQTKKKTVRVGAVLSPLDGGSITFGNDYFGLITTTAGFSNYYEDAKYISLSAYLKDEYLGEMTDETDKEINTFLTAISSSSGERVNVYSAYGNEQESKMVNNMLFVAILAVMILLLCGSASIINTSLTSRIRESKREIGVLRSVGATQKDLTASYIRQLFAMFGWGVGTGFAILVISFIGIGVYEKVKDVNVFIEPDFIPAIASSVVLFAICSLNLYLKIKKETKNSIIDNIREL